MIEEVGSYPHNLSNSSPVDLRRSDLPEHVERTGREPRPHPVAARAVDHRAQQEHREAGVGGQLGRGPHPARPVVHALGRHDRRRRCRSSRRRATAGSAATRPRRGKKLWEFDTNPKDSVWPRTRNELIATPVIYQDRVYIANGQDPEHGEGVGHFYAIDAHQARRHHQDRPASGTSTRSGARSPPPPSPTACVYVSDFSGYLHCLDAKTGQEYWIHDLLAAVWGSPFLIDGKVYLGDEDGDVVVMAHGKEKKSAGRDEHGQRRVRDDRAGERRAVHQQPEPAVRHRRNQVGRHAIRAVSSWIMLAARAGAGSVGARSGAAPAGARPPTTGGSSAARRA